MYPWTSMDLSMVKINEHY